MSPYAGYLLETFVTLVGVCAVAFVVLYGARRLGVGRASGSVRLVGQLPLDARRAIYLVRVGEHVFVIGVAEGGMTKLGEIAASELPDGEATAAPPFADVLAKAFGRARAAAAFDAGGAEPSEKAVEGEPVGRVKRVAKRAPDPSNEEEP